MDFSNASFKIESKAITGGVEISFRSLHLNIVIFLLAVKGHSKLVVVADCIIKQLVFNPLSPSIKLQTLLLCFHTFLTEVVRRSC